MKIILITVVRGLGRIGDVVQVKSGYARNFLIPRKKAICHTAANAKMFELRKQEFEQENVKNLDSSAKIKDALFGKDVVILENASDDGKLYGSVSSSYIVTKINEILGKKIVVRSDLFLKNPIKETGIYQVSLALHSEVVFEIRLIVARNESEATSLLKNTLKNDKKDHVSDAGSVTTGEESETNITKPGKKNHHLKSYEK